ncbi:hypothetical protein ACXX82_06470 [Glaciimonas sp. GNP009]
MSTLSPASWAVSFGGASIPFATRAEAKRFIKINQKDVADQRGGTFKAVIVRIPTPENGTEAVH